MAASEATRRLNSGKCGGWTIEVLLNTPRRKCVFLLALLIPACVIVAQVGRIALAATLGESNDPARVQRAIGFDPRNPELHYNLGKLRLWGASPDPAEALREMRIATELNGYSPRYWSGLARAALAAGDQPAADRAFARAAELAPSKPSYAWDQALNYVITERPAEAVVHLQRFVTLQPQRAREAFDVLFRTSREPELIWSGLANPSRNIAVQMACLDFLSARGEFEAAARHWNELASTRVAISLEIARPYLERLMNAGRYHEAARVWDYLQGGRALSCISGCDSELLFNGGFEQEPSNAGFDWRYGTQAFLTLDFDDRSAHGGARAVRVDFTVPENLQYEPIVQFVPVMPGQPYVLTAYARSEELTSDSGPRLRVVDPRCPDCLNVTTEPVLGTTPWHRLQLHFTTAPGTEVVRLSLFRPRSRTFPMNISGRFWLDDVSLRLSAPPETRARHTSHSEEVPSPQKGKS